MFPHQNPVVINASILRAYSFLTWLDASMNQKQSDAWKSVTVLDVSTPEPSCLNTSILPTYSVSTCLDASLPNCQSNSLKIVIVLEGSSPTPSYWKRLSRIFIFHLFRCLNLPKSIKFLEKRYFSRRLLTRN